MYVCIHMCMHIYIYIYTYVFRVFFFVRCGCWVLGMTPQVCMIHHWEWSWRCDVNILPFVLAAKCPAKLMLLLWRHLYRNFAYVPVAKMGELAYMGCLWRVDVRHRLLRNFIWSSTTSPIPTNSFSAQCVPKIGDEELKNTIERWLAIVVVTFLSFTES